MMEDSKKSSTDSVNEPGAVFVLAGFAFMIMCIVLAGLTGIVFSNYADKGRPEQLGWAVFTALVTILTAVLAGAALTIAVIISSASKRSFQKSQ